MSAETVEEFLASLTDVLAEKVAVRLAAELPAPTRLLSFEQAGNALGLTRRAVQDLVSAGKLQALKVGALEGSSKIEQAELEAYIARQREAARS